MAIDTLLVVVGVYGSVDDAKADYDSSATSIRRRA